MKASHRRGRKIGVLGATLVAASAALAQPGAETRTIDAAAHMDKATITATQAPAASATATETPSATPAFLQSDCPVTGRNHLEGATTEPEGQYTPTPAPDITQTAQSVPGTTFSDGQYAGAAERAGGWGMVQVRAVIEDGKLVDIIVVDYPHALSQSSGIAHRALPILICEALQAQKADVDFVTRATATSRAFTNSLQAALLDASTDSTS